MDQKNKWKAWVDNMPGPSSKKSILHVKGDIEVINKAKYSLEKAEPQGTNPIILLLKVIPKPSAGNIATSLEYSEPLDSPTQYKEVQIIEIDTVTIPVKEVS
jgi:hypothetical protein